MPARSTLVPLQPGEGGARSQRLLAAMHKVFSHDLPNQMVALQSLLQLLSLEESTRLSGDGREYVRRMQNAARRASDQVRFLKEMGRLNNFSCRSETITLSSLGRELQGELQRAFPARDFVFEWHWRVPSVVGDVRAILQAIVELCSGLTVDAGRPCRFTGTTQERPETIELAFHLDAVAPTTPPGRTMEGLEVLLAREWLSLCAAELTVTPQGTATAFSIVLPRR